MFSWRIGKNGFGLNYNLCGLTGFQTQLLWFNLGWGHMDNRKKKKIMAAHNAKIDHSFKLSKNWLVSNLRIVEEGSHSGFEDCMFKQIQKSLNHIIIDTSR